MPKSTKHLFTVDEYHKMSDAGIFNEDERVELINGEIIEMPPIGSNHSGGVNRLTNNFCWKLGTQVVVSTQNPVQLNNLSEPQPDIALLKPRNDFYSKSHPKAEDVLLIIEVSDSS